MKFPRLELPSKRTLCLLGYAWLMTFLIGLTLGGPLMTTVTIFGEIFPLPAVTAILGFVVFYTLKFLGIGFFFVWLAEGNWIVRAAGAWLATMLALPVFYAFSTRFSAPLKLYVEATLASLMWPGVLNLAFCLLGAWLAHDNLWRPGLQNARNAVGQFIILPD